MSHNHTSTMKKFGFSLLNKLRTKSTTDQLSLSIKNNIVPGQKPTNLSSLPVELIEQILEQLLADREIWDAAADLFALSATCKYLNLILSNDILYNKVIIQNRRQAKSFYKCICSSKNYKKKASNTTTTRPSLLVKHIVFVHPIKDFQAAMEHMGHMMNTSSTVPEKSWAESILEIITKLPNLEHLELREISPNFEFPAYLMNSFPNKVLPKKLISIFMSSEKGWKVGLTESLLWPFVSYQKLYLHSMALVVLNHSKYATQSNFDTSSPGLSSSPKSSFALSHSNASSPSNTTPQSVYSSYFPSTLPHSHNIILSRCEVYPESRHSISDRSANYLSIDAYSLQTCDLPSTFPQLEYLNIGCIDESSFLPECDQLISSNLTILNSGVPPVQFFPRTYAQNAKISTLSDLEPIITAISAPESIPLLKSLLILLSHNLIPSLLVALSERIASNKCLKSCTIIVTTRLNELNQNDLSRLSNVIDSSTSLEESLDSFTVKDLDGSSFI